MVMAEQARELNYESADTVIVPKQKKVMPIIPSKGYAS